MSTDELRALYEHGLSTEEFAAHTADVLSSHGFSPGNALAIVGVCRDEMMFPVEQALYDVWGPAFDMSSLGGMVFLGASGLAAAGGHAPGVDGRRRFIHIVMPHIGLDDERGVGFVRRDGQNEPSTACGALVGLQRQLLAGEVSTALDRDDLEMSLLRSVLVEHIVGPTPDLFALTDLARQVATTEIVRLSAGLLASPTTDVAVFSTMMIHGPRGDRVVVADARLWTGSDPVPTKLG